MQLSKSFTANQYKEVLPGYNWPLLSGLEYIISNINEIYLGKIKLNDIQPNIMAGQYLKDILKIFFIFFVINITINKIDSLMKNQNHQLRTNKGKICVKL